ncbi:type II toxin-antitoxin system RelE/ParE family toxin [Halomonas sp. E14]|uniref:type II toxin-antitoxin system RelE/ParE family toxin n=1 Tax=Halomonas sp. E14 TaxID=3397245 RepID=UPI00403E7B5D
MLPIVWLDGALADLSAIVSFIAEENPGAARRLKARLATAPLALSEHPYLYPAGRVSGTRELVAHPNYLIVYRVTSTRIEVISVVHTRRQYPPAE